MEPKAQTADIDFERERVGPPGTLVELTPMIRRMVAPNPGPMTFTGTCTYVVGRGTVAIIDPGPDSATHIENLLAALAGETVSQILITHTHRDHCGAAAALKEATSAQLIGCAPYAVAAKPSPAVDERGRDSGHELAYAPDAVLREGEVVKVGELSLDVVATPGHTGNHLCFALRAERALFSGDHVMAWSTSVVIPPDGAMADYMASLEKLQQRDDAIYWPGHGGPVRAPQNYLTALIRHRRLREASILTALGQGAMTIPELVAAIYRGLDPRLQGAARLSVLAHLEDLSARGLVHAESSESGSARYRRV